jgi:predicted secreted hydrolase
MSERRKSPALEVGREEGAGGAMSTRSRLDGWYAATGLCVLLLAPVVRSWSQVPEPGSVFEPAYRLAVPGYAYGFPRDHGSHPDYKIEWWYFTGNLDGAEGTRLGYELTFFRLGTERRSRNPSVWNVEDLYVAHFALSHLSDGRFSFFERVNRAGPGIAYASTETLDVRNESWTARLVGDVMHLRAYADGILLELELSSEKPPVVHGIDGVSQKADGVGQASHYYSMTRMETRGTVSIDGEAVAVTGETWMDHEFGTNQLATEQVGWDWFSLQLDNGEELMAYRLRRRDGSIDPNSSATAVSLEGQGRHLEVDELSVRSLRDWLSPKSGVVYRLEWELEIPGLNSRLHVVPLMDDQELVTTRSTGVAYWEGAVRLEGSWKGEPVTGRGYVELTGYSEEYRPGV